MSEIGATYSVDELARILDIDPPGEPKSFEGVSIDSRTLEPGQVFFAIKGDNFDGHRFVAEAIERGAVAAVVSRRESGDLEAAGPCLAVSDTLAALQKFAGYHRNRFDIPVLAITGSTGKTSSKDLMAAVLASKYRVMKTQGNLNNEIGCPLSLLQLDADVDIAVVEMGANHRGEIRGLCALARPSEATITLIAASHLEGFGSIEGVAAAKGEIVESLPADGVFYVNADDARCLRVADSFSGQKVFYGTKGGSLHTSLDVCMEQFDLVDAGEVLVRIDPVGELRLPLHSEAHVSNVLPAIAAGLQHGVSDFQDPLREACKKLSRLQILSVRGVEILDDTYNANPVSVKASLDALKNRPGTASRIVALGDMLELGEDAGRYHREIGEWAGKCGATHLYVRGEYASDTIEAALKAGVPEARCIDRHEDIAEAIFEVARPGDAVLVKGSRGMTMEKVVDLLQGMLERGREAHESACQG